MNMEVGTGVKPRLFYGWWIVAAGFVVIAYGLGVQNYMLSQLSDLVRALGGNANQIATAWRTSGVVGIIALLAIGPLIDKFGPRKLMFISILVVSSGFIALGFTNSLPTLYFLQGILAIGIIAAFDLPVQTATANWFMKRRSVALAVICAAPVLGNSIINLLGEQIAGLFDLQGAFLGLGVVMLVIGIPLALVIRHRPEQHGDLPDGRLPAIEETGQSIIEKESLVVEVNFTLWQALRTKPFWMLTIAMVLVNWVGYIAVAFRPLYLSERGFAYTTTLNIFELAPLMGLAWMLIFGFLGDKFPKRYLLAIAIALQSISVVVLMAVGNTTQLYLYMLVYGFGSGIVPLILAIRADYFGRKAFATITAVMGFASAIIYAGLNFLSSWIFRIPGILPTAFLLSMLVGFIAAVMFFLARPPEQPRQALADHEAT